MCHTLSPQRFVSIFRNVQLTCRFHVAFNKTILAAANVSVIKSAMDQYAQTTCVRFVPRTTEAEYITIGNGASGCWSYVGRSLENQYNQVNLQIPSCITTGTVAHELMHALGFYHEFSRPDRDDYVSIDIGALAPKYQTGTFFA